jgi:sulfur-carrier protein adenylyltransferase/sulfurtransferase
MIPEISPSEFVRRRDAGEDLLLLDVREPQELEVASVPGALHIPMGEVPGRLGEIDRNREVVVLCRSGGRSLRVAMFLVQQGFGRVANLDGGILRWAEELDPTMATY